MLYDVWEAKVGSDYESRIARDLPIEQAQILVEIAPPHLIRHIEEAIEQ